MKYNWQFMHARMLAVRQCFNRQWYMRLWNDRYDGAIQDAKAMYLMGGEL